MNAFCKNTQRVLTTKEQPTKGQEPQWINSHVF